MYRNTSKIYLYFLFLVSATVLTNSLFAKQENTNAFEIEAKRLNTLIEIKENDHRINSIVKKGIEKIRWGDKHFLQNIQYDTMLLFAIGINNIALETQEHPFYIISEKTPDRIIKKAILGGLSNKDPRIRLFALTTLKQMELDNDFKTINTILRITKNETVHSSYYYFVDLNLNIHFANINIELTLLEKQIRRMIVTKSIKSYAFDPVSFVTISRENFIAINKNIMDEEELDIPIKTFDETKLNHLISGLANKDPHIKTECAKHIYNIYNNNKTSTQTKRRIDKLLKSSFSFEKEVIKEKYRMNFLFKQKPYNKFIIEGSSILKTVFFELDKKRKKQEIGKK